MELVEVGPNVHALLQPDRGLGWSNSGLITGDGGVVVDTFWDLPRTQRAMDLYAEKLPGGPARRVVNTHHNGDHCWGNKLYADAGAEIIGHRRCAEFMSREDPTLLQRLATADPDSLPPHLRGFARALSAYDFTGVEICPPTTLVDDGGATLDVGGREVRLLSLGPAHTAGDVAVHLPDAGVVFTGDLLFNQCTPIGWEGTAAQWMSALETLAALDCPTVVPGHGPLGTSDDLLAMRDYLGYVFDEARRHFEAGRTPLEASKLIELGPYAGWNEPERLAFNVHRAYRELRGGSWDEPVEMAAVWQDIAALADHLAER
jgi:glyoxylase-like metal-dependent hydrolase (beta-lactamase superfamily II)